MTAQQLYEAALGVIPEEKERAGSYENLKLPAINQVVAECFNINNSIRESEGLAPLGKNEMPFVNNENDEIPYDIWLLRVCMPYGVASILVLDDDKQKATAFSQQYESYKAESRCASFEAIKDAYSEPEV